MTEEIAKIGTKEEAYLTQLIDKGETNIMQGRINMELEQVILAKLREQLEAVKSS